MFLNVNFNTTIHLKENDFWKQFLPYITLKHYIQTKKHKIPTQIS